MGVFDEMASRYDNEERARVAGIIAAEIRGTLGDTQSQTAIDYGCGTGLVGLPLAGCFRQLLMVDSSPQMVELLQGKIERDRLTNVRALCADFAAGVPEDLQADIIFMAQVLLHIPDTQHILRQMRRLLPSCGRLIIVDFDKEESIDHPLVHNGFVQEDLMALARGAGFSAAQAHTFYHGQRLFMNQDASLFLLEATV